MLATKCDVDCKAKKLCPVSFGLAVGVVSFFAVFIWTLWVIQYGMPPMMVEMHIPMPTVSGGLVHALLALVKGFLFGFFVALLYDCFSSCFACCFGRKQSGEGGKLSSKK